MENLENKSNNSTNNLDNAAYVYYQNPDEKNIINVIKSGSRLIGYFIRLYGYNSSKEDLNQVGIEGLLKGLRRFNPDSGISFSTYSWHCISGEIQHYIRKENSYLYPDTIKKLRNNIKDTILNEWNITGNFPEITDIAKELNVQEDGIREVLRLNLLPLEEIDLSKVESQRYESFKLPIEDRLVLEQALNKLNGLQKKVIRMLFYRDMTQEQAAAKLQINQRKVSRLLQSSLKLMRSAL